MITIKTPCNHSPPSHRPACLPREVSLQSSNLEENKRFQDRLASGGSSIADNLEWERINLVSDGGRKLHKIPFHYKMEEILS